MGGDLIGHARDDGDTMDRLPLLDAVIVLGDLSIRGMSPHK